MNKYNLQIKSVALNDIEKIADFIANDNVVAARNFVANLYEKFDNLCFYPELGRVRKDFTYLNVRFLRVKRNYLVVYNIENKTVVILRVLSTYQEICNLL